MAFSICEKHRVNHCRFLESFCICVVSDAGFDIEGVVELLRSSCASFWVGIGESSFFFGTNDENV